MQGIMRRPGKLREYWKKADLQPACSWVPNLGYATSENAPSETVWNNEIAPSGSLLV